VSLFKLLTIRVVAAHQGSWVAGGFPPPLGGPGVPPSAPPWASSTLLSPMMHVPSGSRQKRYVVVVVVAPSGPRGGLST